MFDRQALDALVTDRMVSSRPQRERSRHLIARGKAGLAEEVPERREGFALRMAVRDLPIPPGAEAVQGDTVDFVDAIFLTLGARAARAVALIFGDGGRTPLGSGFLVSPRLLITNNHVLLDEEAAASSWAAFNYEAGENLTEIEPTYFSLRPDLFFFPVTWRDLDLSLVAVGDRVRGTGTLAAQGFCPLSDRPDKHAKGAAVNIVQHPNGWRKKIVLRENRIVARLDRVLHYEADTEGGSSGSPVFNDAWEVVALHHWGKPFLETRTIDGVEVPVTVNEGVRISKVVDRLREEMERSASGSHRDYLGEVLSGAAPVPPAVMTETRDPPPEMGRESAVTEDALKPRPGTATLIVPLEITFRVLGSGEARLEGLRGAVKEVERLVPPVAPPGPERVVLDTDYTNRQGYNPVFLPGLRLPLADIVAPVRARLAALKADQPDSRAGELKYEHFSVLMNAERRFAFVTATNIDGATYIDIDRDTGLPAEAGSEGETWYDDDRMETDHYVGQRFYSANSTYFDRGHLTRRTDPTWGTKTRAVRANADTFHRTNCTPQHWLFNQSLRFWQGIERHYLEFGATLDKSRLTVFQGPVFGSDDPVYKDLDQEEVKVPLQFWKIVVRVESDVPKATGLVAGQQKLLQRKRGGISREERESEEAPVVDEFLASLSRIERLSGLSLEALKPFDTFRPVGPEGGEANEIKLIKSWADLS